MEMNIFSVCLLMISVVLYFIHVELPLIISFFIASFFSTNLHWSFNTCVSGVGPTST